MQPIPIPSHYLTSNRMDAAAVSDPSAQMHPAVMQHLLQQQQLQQQLALMQATQGGLAGLGYSQATAPPSLNMPVYAGAPLMQQHQSGLGGLQLPLIGPAARSDSASTSASSSVENAVPSTSSSNTHRSPPSSPPSSETVETVRLHIANIPYKWREADLEKIFKDYGEVIASEIIFNERGSKGFGFVTLANREAADAARAALNGKVFDGRVVEVNSATAKMSSRGKAKILNVQKQQQQQLQLALLQQQMPLIPTATSPDQQLAMQQLLLAQQVLAQFAAQQQLQGLAPMQQQMWMQPNGAASAADLDKHQRRMGDDMKRYHPY